MQRCLSEYTVSNTDLSIDANASVIDKWQLQQVSGEHRQGQTV